ncbi:MAG TPA: CmcJ/NvfI family oxidoreductase [Steroidobacteraceae bacterium]
MVEATVNYFGELNAITAAAAHGSSADRLQIQPTLVPIRDARAAPDPPRLEREGFTLARHRSAVGNYHDAGEVTHVYLPEAAQLLRRLTGAVRVVMMPGAVLRFGERSPQYASATNLRPARFVHVDYTERSARGLLRSVLPAQEPLPQPGQRYAGYNIWRVISPPPQDIPLAVCDARTVAREDLLRGDTIFRSVEAVELRFEALLLHSNPAHRWSYFSQMHPEEVIVFKAFDSDYARPVRVPHSAFDDPLCPRRAPARESIEVRGFALFD